MRLVIGAISAAALLAGCASTVNPEATSAAALPSAELSAYVAGIEPERARGGDEILNLKVTDVSADSVYRDAVEAAKSRGEYGIELPLQMANELILMLRPDLSAGEAEAALKTLKDLPSDCSASRTVPQIGLVIVTCFDIEGELEGASLAQAAEKPINRLAERLRRDGRFASVTANTVVSPQSILSAVIPERERGDEETGEATDWGVGASKIDLVWPLLTRRVDVGVIDVGFADHVDLPMTHGLPDAWSVQDHGNHVAGIMCARHNGLGVKGVLPNCSVAAAGGSFLIAGYSPIEGDDAIAFQARLSEYLATVLTFMEKNPDAKVINLSLGYNWMPNFRADPRTPDNAFLRDIVRSQGRIFQAILAYAKARDIVIFSAAGNDSTSLSSPLEAKWASPFNFGAKLMKDAEGWSNGVIVEAHGQNNRRASFSNVGGDISCPGVDIKSSLARPSNSYGLMSGTSMASPYCAASYAALRSLHPTLPVRKTLECYLGVSGRIEGRVPKMDLKAAHEACQQ